MIVLMLCMQIVTITCDTGNTPSIPIDVPRTSSLCCAGSSPDHTSLSTGSASPIDETDHFKHELLERIFNKLWDRSQEYDTLFFGSLQNWKEEDENLLKDSLVRAYNATESSKTVRKFIELGKAYDFWRSTGTESTIYNQEQQFMDAVVNSQMFKDVMHEFPRDLDIMDAFNKEYLYKVWFSNNRYQARNRGFKHVFFGDEGIGLHNWLRVVSGGHLDSSQIKACQRKGPNIMSILTNRNKYSTMFVGTVPEFDMLVYSLCFWAFGGDRCTVKVAGTDLKIMIFIDHFRWKVYADRRHRAKHYTYESKISTAYPKCNWFHGSIPDNE